MTEFQTEFVKFLEECGLPGSSWFKKEVGDDGRILRKWKSGEDVPDHENWNLVCQIIKKTQKKFGHSEIEGLLSQLDRYRRDEQRRRNGIQKKAAGQHRRGNKNVFSNSSTEEDLDYLSRSAIRRAHAHTARAFETSIRKYEELVQKRGSPEDFIGLAHAYINSSCTGFCADLPVNTIPKARQTIDDALTRHKSLAAIHALSGFVYLIYDYDWYDAEKEINKALSIDKHDEYSNLAAAHLNVLRGRFDIGLNHVRLARNRYPDRPHTTFTLPWFLVFAGQQQEAIAECQKGLKEFDPFPVGHIFYGHALLAAGEVKSAIIEYQRAFRIEPMPDALASLSHAYGISGDHRRAHKYLDRLEFLMSMNERVPFVPAYYLALVSVGMGRNRAALDSLDKAFEQRCDWLVQIGVDPRWKRLHKEPRFLKLAQKVGVQFVGQ